MKVILLELHHLPCTGYFSSMVGADRVILERHEQYQKQSYRNRCRVRTAQRIETLTVPVRSSHHVPITRVPIDYSQRWQPRYWRTLEAAYGRAPFFEHYAGAIKKTLLTRYEYLYQLNLELLKDCLRMLKLSVELAESEVYSARVESGTTDLRDVINVKKPELTDNYYRIVPYTQVFGAGFEKNLSVIDLLFCMGPESAGIIRASATRR